MKIKIDEKTVRSLPLSKTGQTYYFDTKLAGFGVCVGKAKKTFFLQRTKNYKTYRIALGRYEEINCTQARDKALAAAAQIANDDEFGTTRKAKTKLRKVTLQALYEQYLPSLIAQQKHVSTAEYPQILRRHFSDWLPKPIITITKDTVIERHRYLTKNFGPSIANKAFRVIRALFNYAMIDNETLLNPVKILTARKLWNPEKHKTSRIKANELPAWFQHVMLLPNPITKFYLLFLLLHGLRKTEAANLRWSDIDFHNDSLLIRQTKNKKTAYATSD